MTFTINQIVCVVENCIVTGEYLTQGMRGTVIAISEYQQPPIIIVKFPKWILPMRVHEIEAVAEP